MMELGGGLGEGGVIKYVCSECCSSKSAASCKGWLSDLTRAIIFTDSESLLEKAKNETPLTTSDIRLQSLVDVTLSSACRSK